MAERSLHRPVARSPAAVLARQTSNVIDRDLIGNQPPVQIGRL
jgi:hypothetical protein